MRTAIYTACLGAGLIAAPAFADACDNAATQSAMNACYGNALKTADKTLNDTYRQVSDRLASDPDTKKQLVTAQRAWIAFRDAECAFSASGAEGGSIYPMIKSICLADMTTERTSQLAALLRCEEGDLSCPVPGE